MKRIKSKLMKMLPNNKYVAFKNSHSFSIEEVTYLLWGIERDGKNIWVDMEDNSGFMSGRYYYPFVDIDERLYPYIMKYLEKIK